MNTNAQLDAEVVTAELVASEPSTLFRTSDPVAVQEEAKRVAAALKGTLDSAGMTMKIGRSEHVLIDGWQTLGAMLGVSAHVVWSRPLIPLHDAAGGWEARAEAKTLAGLTVGSAEAMVTRDERNWKNADDYAIRSMAQTRAMSKALRGPLGFVIALAGKSATPAEEVDRATGEVKPAPAWAADIEGAAVMRFEEALILVLQDGAAAGRVAEQLMKFCDGTIPAACARLLKLIADERVGATEPDDAEVEGDA